MIKKFHAATTRDALRQVRDALGANAIILSNRQVEGGVEIIAVADLDMAALAEQAEPARPRAQAPRPSASRPPPARPPAALAATATQPTPPLRPAPAPLQAGQGQANPVRRPPPPVAEPDPPPLTSFTDYLALREASVIRPTPSRKPGPGTAPRPAQVVEPAAPPPHYPEPAVGAPPSAEAELSPVMRELAREMRMLRGLVEGQLAGLAWNDLCRREPYRAEIMKRLLAAGFSPALTKQLLEKMPAEQDQERAMRWVRAAIAHNLKVADPADDLVDRGGIYALVGPTGVGKTTTVAKLAARAVLKHGSGKVAMVTTDSYRIGAQDQLRIYGRILGSPVFVVRDENDLELTLLDLQTKHLVFIDTIGMSQKDKRVIEQTSMLSGRGGLARPVKRLLLLGAPSQGITLEEVVRAYGGPGLAGCVLTKIDEALTFGPVLDVVIRHQLLVRYVTNGQRVPEDLHLANARYLVDRAFRLGSPDTAFAPEEGDYPVLMAAADTDPFAGGGYPDPHEAYGAAG
jgi:flagellar biosynthesis protein FlhF